MNKKTSIQKRTPGALHPACSAARPMRKGKGMVLMFQSAVSGLWYYNYQAAGDVSAVRVNGEIYTKQSNEKLTQDARR